MTTGEVAAYWDTLNVQVVDAHTVEIIAKKAGKTMLTEVDAISPDGNTALHDNL